MPEPKRRGRPSTRLPETAAPPNATPAAATSHAEVPLGITGRLGHGNTFEVSGRLLWRQGESWSTFEERANAEYEALLQQYRSTQSRTMTAGSPIQM